MLKITNLDSFECKPVFRTCSYCYLLFDTRKLTKVILDNENYYLFCEECYKKVRKKHKKLTINNGYIFFDDNKIIFKSEFKKELK